MSTKHAIIVFMITHKSIPLAPYTSLKVGGPAKLLYELEGPDELIDALKKHTTDEVWMLGSGTNSLISDKGLSGVVITNNEGDIRVDDTTVTADSGVNWDKLVQKTIESDLYGFELMSGIPGGVGAAIVGNIAAYGQKIADTFVSARIFNRKTNATQTLRKSDLGFDYRTSMLTRHPEFIIIDATFELSKKPTMQLEYESALQVAKKLHLVPHGLEDRRKIIMETRRQAGSLLLPSSDHATAGSFFKNPVVNEKQVDTIVSFEETGISKEKLLRQNKLHGGQTMRVSAAHVLLAAGFKRGQTWGNVRLHPDHILKIENTGRARAQEIHDVVEYIIGTVKSRLGVTLEPEVRFLGDFN